MTLTTICSERQKFSRLLIVEDDPNQLLTLTDIMSDEGFDVTGCPDAACAVELIKKQEYVVAIVDLKLPDLRGEQLLGKIKQVTGSPRVIIYTGYGSFESAKDAVNLGAFAYVEKLSNPDELLRQVHRAFKEAIHLHVDKLAESVAERTKDLTAANECLRREIDERKRVEEKLKSSHQQLRNLSVHLQSIREEERSRIAREIHDELGQVLTALKLDMFWLTKRLSKNQKTSLEKLNSMSELIDSTIERVQRISAALRPGILDDLGLVAAMLWQAEEFLNRTGIDCCVNIEPEEFFLDTDRTTTIFRIFQETLTNVVRHARATRVEVNLEEKTDTVSLRVKDNGIGISNKEITDSKSIGLIGIRERVIAWGGDVSVKGSPKKGTTVTISIPIENQQ